MPYILKDIVAESPQTRELALSLVEWHATLLRRHGALQDASEARVMAGHAGVLEAAAEVGTGVGQ